MDLAEIRDCPKVRVIVRRQYPERYVFDQPSLSIRRELNTPMQ
jgi:hypothetical protein